MSQFVYEVKAGLDLPLPSNHLEKYFTHEVKQTIQKYTFKRSPGYDLITDEVVRCLSKKAIVFTTCIFNASLRLSYFLILLKFSKLVLFAKLEKRSP